MSKGSSSSDENTVGCDLEGTLSVQSSQGGAQQYVKSLMARVATAAYQKRVKLLGEQAGAYAAPLLEYSLPNGRLTFAHEGWEPFGNWCAALHSEEFFPLERALKVAVDLCETLQKIWEELEEEPEIHSGLVLVSEADTPSCRFLLYPKIKDFRPADHLRCTLDVLLCTPPEALCGQPGAQPQVYTAAMMLRLIFTNLDLSNWTPATLIEQLVGRGFQHDSLAPPRLPAGLNHVLRLEWEKLTNLIARATARHPRARDVTLELLSEACQTIQDCLVYWQLAEVLCFEGQPEKACGVLRYGMWAKSYDGFWRRAFKRKCGEIYLKDLHKYDMAAAIFQEYLGSETEDDPHVMAQVRESFGDALAFLGIHTMALSQYESALAYIADRDRLYLKIADAHRGHRNYPKALETLQRLLNDNPNNLQALRSIAEICLEQGDTDSARDYSARALQVARALHHRGALEGESPDRVFADIHSTLGMCFLLEGQYDDAQILATRALREDYDCYKAHNIFGLIYFQKGKSVPALRSFMASLRLNPAQPKIQKWLENVLELKGGAQMPG